MSLLNDILRLGEPSSSEGLQKDSSNKTNAPVGIQILLSQAIDGPLAAVRPQERRAFMPNFNARPRGSIANPPPPSAEVIPPTTSSEAPLRTEFTSNGQLTNNSASADATGVSGKQAFPSTAASSIRKHNPIIPSVPRSSFAAAGASDAAEAPRAQYGQFTPNLNNTNSSAAGRNLGSRGYRTASEAKGREEVNTTALVESETTAVVVRTEDEDSNLSIPLSSSEEGRNGIRGGRGSRGGGRKRSRGSDMEFDVSCTSAAALQRYRRILLKQVDHILKENGLKHKRMSTVDVSTPIDLEKTSLGHVIAHTRRDEQLRTAQARQALKEQRQRELAKQNGQLKESGEEGGDAKSNVGEGEQERGLGDDGAKGKGGGGGGGGNGGNGGKGGKGKGDD
uniref:Uncharacterized protein n=1 Tax=Polytomella parva TaxID=51329 RepID=A0A7S0UTQ7_9CHLO|mmetsp:Transcript_17543/g.32062  ORF Transcript_17543/g.32062 Transcript_17543/m.32062 type:complete len:394 (+) Transcript_17543:146-1327(+)